MQSGHAEPKCDAWFVFILSNLSEVERVAMHGNASTANLTFRRAVNRQLQTAGDRASLNLLFETWFTTWDSADVDAHCMAAGPGNSGVEGFDSHGSKRG